MNHVTYMEGNVHDTWTTDIKVDLRHMNHVTYLEGNIHDTWTTDTKVNLKDT